jgi:hypothetical protein
MGKLPAQTYQDIYKKKADFEYIRNKLKLKHLEEKEKFIAKHPKVNEFLLRRRIDIGKIREHSAKIIGSGIISGSLLLTSPGNVKALPAPHEIIEIFKLKLGEDKDINNTKNENTLLVEILSSILPEEPRPLQRNEEKLLEQIFNNIIGVPARATLESEHLNTTYGYIGAEQHLFRYPGDKLSEHGDVQTLKSGMASGLGAWGYFAYSKDNLTPDLVEKEKYYAVVQTLYLPDWDRRQPYLKNWYKFRKVLIVNTQNGNAIIASIADSGPAAWTGKNFGGSPEVMNYLGGLTYKKGPVIVFFIDDPENKIPLGPVEYNGISIDNQIGLQNL